MHKLRKFYVFAVVLGQEQQCMGIYCRPAGIYIYLHPVAVHAQSFAVESTYTTLTVKARAGLRSAAWGKLIHVGPASQPSYQYVLCTGLLGPVLKCEISRATVSDHAQGEKVLMYLQS